MNSRDLDRGLRAVERARTVNERNSRVGLQQVNALRAARRARAEALQEHLRASVEDGLTPDYVAGRSHLVMIGEALDIERARLADAEALHADAHARWSGDKVRLSAVEHLLERRTAHRRAELQRRERAELDDVAARLWLGRRGAFPPSSTATATATATPDAGPSAGTHPDSDPQEGSA